MKTPTESDLPTDLLYPKNEFQFAGDAPVPAKRVRPKAKKLTDFRWPNKPVRITPEDQETHASH